MLEEGEVLADLGSELEVARVGDGCQRAKGGAELLLE